MGIQPHVFESPKQSAVFIVPPVIEPARNLSWRRIRRPL
jgi:hypothetical protein